MTDSLEIGEALERLKNAVQEFLQKDIGLLERNVSERSIMHRLAVHLGPRFPRYDVDCEYNRNGGKPKSLRGNRGSKRVNLPDIIVHRRTLNTSNLLIIEIKKSNDTRKQGEQYDRDKVAAFVEEEPYYYKLGVFIEFNVHRRGDPPVRMCCYRDNRWSEVIL